MTKTTEYLTRHWRAVFAAASLSSVAGAQDHVGHRFEMIPDSSRTYAADVGPVARPLHVMLWYPATPSQTRSIVLRDYVRVPGSYDPPRSPAALNAYRATFAGDTGDALQPAALARFLEMPNGVALDATALPGRHPLLLLQTGLNAPAYLFTELAESLARGGFIVATIASFGHRDDTSLSFDSAGVATQVADLRHTLSWLRRQPFVDTSRIAIGGWSVGALSAFALAVHEPSQFRALVSLDGGVGYDYGVSLAARFGVRAECAATPLLHMTGTQPSAFRVARNRALVNSVPRGNAFWATIHGLGHAEFTSHMGSRSPLLPRRRDRDAVLAGTRQLERTVAGFLRLYVVGESAAWTTLVGRESIESVGTTNRQCAEPQPAAQLTPSMVNRDEVVVASLSDRALIEPHLSVNPVNPRHLAVIAMTARTSTSTTRGDYGPCAVTASFDGGATWLPPDSVGGGVSGCADPWIVTMPSGLVVAAVLGDSGIEVYRSPDGGRQWVPGARLQGAFDHEMLLRGPDGQSIILVSALSMRDQERRLRGAVYVGISRDGGLSFHEQSRAVFSNLSYEATTPVLLAGGRLAVPFGDHRRWTGQRLAQRRQWLAISSDTGRSFDVPMLITEDCNQRRGLPIGWASTVVTPSRDSAPEQLVFVCEGPDAAAIVVTTSADGGDTWSNVVRIAPPAGDGAVTKAPVIAANGQTVALGFTFATDSASSCNRLFGALSRDGGRTFDNPQPWATGHSCPTAIGNGAAVLRRFPFGGDYFGLVPLSPTSFYAVWADARAGRFELRGARLEAIR